MKKILILVDELKPNKKEFVKLIRQHLAGSEVSIDLRKFESLFFDIDGERFQVKVGKTSIGNYDLVYFRKAGKEFSVLAGTLAIALEHMGVKYFDTTFGVIGPKGGKFTALVRLASKGLPIPRTVYFSEPSLVNHFDYLSQNLGLPFVAKDLSIQRGEGVFLIRSKEDCSKLPYERGKDGKNQYLFQRMIDKEHEYRLLVLGDGVGVWEEKIAQTKGEFRNNVALGAREVFMDITDLPGDLEKVSVGAAKALGIQIAGVDVIRERITGKVYLLEVNRGPGLTYDESISPEFREIADFLKKEASK